jgi:hypothetical protein
LVGQLADGLVVLDHEGKQQSVSPNKSRLRKIRPDDSFVAILAASQSVPKVGSSSRFTPPCGCATSPGGGEPFAKGALVAVGDVQPTSRSVVYNVRIEYRAGDPPEVTVLSPKLVPREEGGRLPHVYPGDKLCLYTPYTGQWTPDMSLPHTIVPWISEWLFYYELWHATGEWLGGGTEPAANETIRNEKEKSYERN